MKNKFHPKDKAKASRKKAQSLTNQAKIRLPKDFQWKLLVKLAEEFKAEGSLQEDDFALIQQIARDRDLSALFLLEECWGLQSINLNCDAEAHYPLWVKYQLSALLSKYRFETERSTRLDSALQKFRKAEEACWEYNHGGYTALTWADDEWMVEVYTYARNWLRKLLGEKVVYSSCTHWVRHGPGSTLDTRNGHNSVYFKYLEWPYSCTQDAILYARNAILDDQRWFGALQDSYRERFNIPKHLPLNMEVFWSRVIKVVPGNRIEFVPKNAKTERSIAIEPCLNLYLQLGVDGFIRRKLKRYDVDLDDQSKNQRLANLGSKSQGDDDYVTLDLSSASDMISLRLCKELLPTDWYHFLLHLRSPEGEHQGEVFQYQKISSMGNGYTFALESAIFTAITAAVVRQIKGTVNWKEDLCIFGDDIICRKGHASKVVGALQSCGFTVNTNKSFLFGCVRESCGTDWRKGLPLRPVFLAEAPETVMDLWVVRNSIQRVLHLRRGYAEGSETVKWLDRWTPEKFRRFVGPCSDTEFDSHIHSPSSFHGVYKRGVWKHLRLVKQPVEIRGCRDFLFRKLMHPLRQGPDPSLVTSYKTKEIKASSRFTVIARNVHTVRSKYSAARDIWQSGYNEAVA